MTINRRLFLGMLTVFSVAAGAFASTPEEIATEFFRNSSPENLRQAKSLRLESIDTESDMFKVYNRPGGGFVLLQKSGSSWDIVAYNTEGEFVLRDENKTVVEDIFTAELAESAPVNKVRAAGRAFKGPYLTTKWGQGYPFNRYCPYDTEAEKFMYVGCTTTAMAQLLYYHRQPASTEYRRIDWDHMRDTYEEGTYSMEEADAVALFMADLSQEATRTSYGTKASSGIVPLRYNGYTRIRVDKRDWATFLNQVDEPQILSIRGQYFGGSHCVVMDGIDSNGFWHINWGWEGLCDGWYSPSGFSIKHGTGVEIYKPNGSDAEDQRFLNRDPKCYEPVLALSDGVEIKPANPKVGETVTVTLKGIKYLNTEYFQFSFQHIMSQSFGVAMYYPFPWENVGYASRIEAYEPGYVGKRFRPAGHEHYELNYTEDFYRGIAGSNVSVSFVMPDIPEGQEMILRPEYYFSYTGYIDFLNWSDDRIFQMSPDNYWRPFHHSYSSDGNSQIPNCFILRRQADGTVQTTTTSVGDLILKAREISGVEQVALEPATDGPVEIYTLNGIRTTATTLGDLTPGLYIVRQGSTAKKIYIR